MRGEITELGRKEGLEFPVQITKRELGALLSARTLLQTVSFLMLLQRLNSKGFCDLRSGLRSRVQTPERPTFAIISDEYVIWARRLDAAAASRGSVWPPVGSNKSVDKMVNWRHKSRVSGHAGSSTPLESRPLWALRGVAPRYTNEGLG